MKTFTLCGQSLVGLASYRNKTNYVFQMHHNHCVRLYRLNTEHSPQETPNGPVANFIRIYIFIVINTLVVQ